MNDLAEQCAIYAMMYMDLEKKVAALQAARTLPDCRTCAHFMGTHAHGQCFVEPGCCTNGDRYEPPPPVRLWRAGA